MATTEYLDQARLALRAAHTALAEEDGVGVVQLALRDAQASALVSIAESLASISVALNDAQGGIAVRNPSGWG